MLSFKVINNTMVLLFLSSYTIYIKKKINHFFLKMRKNGSTK